MGMVLKMDTGTNLKLIYWGAKLKLVVFKVPFPYPQEGQSYFLFCMFQKIASNLNVSMLTEGTINSTALATTVT